jgi:hypothetical protein
MLEIEIYAPHFSSAITYSHQAENDQGHPHGTSYPRMGENDFIMATNARGINGKLNRDKLLVFP